LEDTTAFGPSSQITADARALGKLGALWIGSTVTSCDYWRQVPCQRRLLTAGRRGDRFDDGADDMDNRRPLVGDLLFHRQTAKGLMRLTAADEANSRADSVRPKSARRLLQS